MGNEHDHNLVAILAAAAPFLLLAYGMLPASLLNRHPLQAARTAATLSLIAFAFSLTAMVARTGGGKVDVRFTVADLIHLGVYFDSLSAIVLSLVSFLLAVVMRFSVNYLAGDPGQGKFIKWLCLTGGSVLTIVISGNLLQFALAWSATSLCLHQLLVFYPDRPGAVLAARKKFIISRMGDFCLLGVIVLVHQQFHTWDFGPIFAAAGRLHETGMPPDRQEISTICFLLVAGAMMKSAQFPFHSWLPDTMETPTPVSALMHAGIINAGGFLIIRLSPLLTLSPSAMSMLALCGAFTALFASLVMLTHASVKRSLAFSTVAQMGFMMLECGLGAFGLAVLHLVSHSLYKAHAFLSSGSIVSMANSAWVPEGKPNKHPLVLLASFGTAMTLALVFAGIFDLDVFHDRAFIVLSCTFTMALAYALWNLWSQTQDFKLAAFGVVAGAVIVAAYFMLHKIFVRVTGDKPWENEQLNSGPGLILMATLLLLFVFVLVVQTELPGWASRPLFQKLYVHSRNGFYFNTLANRGVGALWPVKMPPINK